MPQNSWIEKINEKERVNSVSQPDPLIYVCIQHIEVRGFGQNVVIFPTDL
jgi:hypothetical protein